MTVPPQPVDPHEARRKRAYSYADTLMAAFLTKWFTGQRSRVVARLMALERLSLASVRDLFPASENVSLRVAFEHILGQAARHTVEVELAPVRPLVVVVTRPTATAPRIDATRPGPTPPPIAAAAAPPLPPAPPPPSAPPAPGAPIPPRPVERFIDVAPSPTARRQPVTRYLVHGQRPNIPELIQARVRQSARRVVNINAVTRRAIREQLRIGLERGYSRLQIAAGVPEDNYAGIGSVVEETYRNRPLTIARTEVSTITNRAVAEAAGLMGYSRVRVFDGPECGWLTHNDPILANGMLVHVRSAYAHPIAHPNAVLEGSTFRSYGKLEEMIRARYHGPAIRLTLPGSHVLTIGPNHPMLTRRGWVPANQLQEFDELIYDARSELTLDVRSPGKPNLEKVPRVENAFFSTLTISRDAYISPTGDDFHGDGVFCYGEIQVIRPVRELLGVWDIGVVEHSSERDLVGTYTQTQAVTRRGSSLTSAERVMLSASGSMGGRLSGVDVRDAHFTYHRIARVETVEFHGWAFDATTETSLYCSDGYVVSNCRRRFTPEATPDVLGSRADGTRVQ